jgi:diacylglycerol O-acyltransferase / wax synthase
MSPARLSALDASFLVAETPSAHMHVGWAAVFDAPQDGPRPTFEDLRDHVAARLQRAPRYRQRLADVPFGIHDPVWVDEPEFDIERHVLDAGSKDLSGIVEVAMSSQLERSRPLWELWLSEELPDGGVGVVGKAHHCMVDGLAAVELASLMLDPDPVPEAPPRDEWEPGPAPGRLALLTHGAVDRVRTELDLVGMGARFAAAPLRRFDEVAGEVRRALLAVGRAIGTPAPESTLNEPISSLRHLGTVRRRLDDLRTIKSRHGTTINDVVLAASAGAMRRFLERRGEPLPRLKAMVPVSVRDPDGASALGNQISFIFVELPCDEPDPVTRLLQIHAATTERKRNGEPEGADRALGLAAYAPQWIQHALTRAFASPRTFNLAVSNIPGPVEPLYMRGCRLREAYPIVPLADQHALSIGVTTIGGTACFGLYADRKLMPDVDLLAGDLDDAIDELLLDDGHRFPPRRRFQRAETAPVDVC